MIMAFIRVLLAWLYVLPVCLVAIVLALFRPFDPSINVACARWLSRHGKALLGLKTIVEGAEHLNPDGPVVVIANHQYNDDLFVVGDLLPPRTVAIGKSSLRWVPLFGPAFWLAGNILIKRGDRAQAAQAMAVTRDAIQQQRKTVLVFPEGTRNHGGPLGNFKQGAFRTAIDAGVPIVMICVQPYDQRTSGWLARRQPVRIRVLPAVSTEGLTQEDVRRLMKHCQQQMQAEIDRLAATDSFTPLRPSSHVLG